MQAFVPKNRKPKFDLTLSIIDLTNIPLVVGQVYIKWHLPSSSSAKHRGRTDKARIADHRAIWDYNKDITVRLTIDKNQALQPCDIMFEILQEYHDGRRGGRVHLGNVKLNLAEYTNAPEPAVDDPDPNGDGTSMITRRYLMQESKVNATLKIGVAMKQVDGDSNFIAPPLKSAMVIGGIAGIMNAEAGEAEDMPSIASKSRELSEAQDIYRRTLAASWACERGELPPDKLIEDLFAGGDGGKMSMPQSLKRLGPTTRLPLTRDDSSTSSDADSRRSRAGSATPSMLTPDMARSGHQRGPSNEAIRSVSQHSVASGVSGRGSIEQQMQHSQPTLSHHHNRRKGQGDLREVTEFDLRNDLRSWQIHVS